MDKMERARELLAAEFTNAHLANAIREGENGLVSISQALRAITAALSTPSTDSVREALEPFARRANSYDGIPDAKYFGDTDCELRHPDSLNVIFTLGQCRRARAALQSSEADNG